LDIIVFEVPPGLGGGRRLGGEVCLDAAKGLHHFRDDCFVQRRTAESCTPCLPHALSILPRQGGWVELNGSRVFLVRSTLQQAFLHQPPEHSAEVARRQATGVGCLSGRDARIPADDSHDADLGRGAGTGFEVGRRRKVPRNGVDKISKLVELVGITFFHERTLLAIIR